MSDHPKDPSKIVGFVPVWPTPKGAVATQAIVSCFQCGAVVKTSGGPHSMTLCLNCTEAWFQTRG